MIVKSYFIVLTSYSGTVTSPRLMFDLTQVLKVLNWRGLPPDCLFIGCLTMYAEKKQCAIDFRQILSARLTFPEMI